MLDAGSVLLSSVWQLLWGVRSESQLVEVLLQRRAALDLQSDLGWTALMCAAASGRLAVVRRLLRAGARTDLRDRHGRRTALQIAERWDHAEEAALLRGARSANARRALERWRRVAPFARALRPPAGTEVVP